MPDSTERAVFRLCVTYLLRDRALKVRLAAGLAYFLVFPILILVNEDRTGIMPVMLVWMLGIVPLSAIEMMRLSSVPDGAELFLFTPDAEPAALFHGARKAALVCVVFPLAVWSVTIATWALRETPEKLLVVFPGLFLIAPVSLVPGLRGDFVPFSQAARSGERAAQVLAVFLTMIPMTIVALGAFFAMKAGYVYAAFGGVLVIAAVLHFALSKWVRSRSSKALRR
jgi:drug/metabolite transporter superfamily protein YnfA